MKLKSQLFLGVVFMLLSCTVIRDHPKQVLPNQEGHYMVTLKMITDDALINNVRNVCIGISSYEEWNLQSENRNYVIAQLQYRNISSNSLNQLLNNLHGIRGIRVIEVKSISY